MIFNLRFPQIALMVLCAASGLSNAYQLATHGLMVERAFERSIISSDLPGGVVSELGLSSWIAQKPVFPFRSASSPLGTIGVATDFWLETNAQSSFQIRYTYDFEGDYMPRDIRSTDLLKINGWLMRGGIREDDGGLFEGWLAGEPYLRDKPLDGRINRFCNHFFDPIASRASPPDRAH